MDAPLVIKGKLLTILTIALSKKVLNDLSSKVLQCIITFIHNIYLG